MRIKHLLFITLLMSLSACGEKPAASDPVPSEPAPPVAETRTQESAKLEVETEPVKKVVEGSAKPAEVTPGSVRLLILSDEAPLGSEQRAIEQTKRKFNGRVIFKDASEEEKECARQYFEGKTPKVIPNGWSKTETVITISLGPPTGVKPKRQTSGIRHIIVLRPPSLTPMYFEKVEPDAGMGLYSLNEWLDLLLKSLEEES